MIGCALNKPVKSSLHSEKVNILKSDYELFNITQNNEYWHKKLLENFFDNVVFTKKKNP